MKNELHLFVLWEKARTHESEAIAEIEKTFEILQTYSITWSPYNVGKNFTRFYGESLPNNSHKALHCGSGEFKLIVVLDKNPVYEIRKTSKGNRTVNINMFDTKAKLRSMTGGGHRIHGTDNETETRHDLVLLTGVSREDFLKKHTERKEDIVIKQDLVGANGWNDFDELFYILNECSEYVVLRNAENINLDYFSKEGGDIDILTKNAIETKYILGDIDGIQSNAGHMKVDVQRNIILFEVYQYGQNLYGVNFENHCFATKKMVKNLYTLDDESEMYALLYHALLYKKTFEAKHRDRILKKYPAYFNDPDTIEEKALGMLIDYFNKNNFKFIPPNDGYFNTRKEIKKLLVKNKNRENAIQKLIKKVVEIETKKREIKIFFFKSLKKLLSIEIEIRYVIRLSINLGKRQKNK